MSPGQQEQGRKGSEETMCLQAVGKASTGLALEFITAGAALRLDLTLQISILLVRFQPADLFL